MQTFVFSSKRNARLLVTYYLASQRKLLNGCLQVKRKLRFCELQILPCKFALQTIDLLNHFGHFVLYIPEQEQTGLKTRQGGRETLSMR